MQVWASACKDTRSTASTRFAAFSLSVGAEINRFVKTEQFAVIRRARHRRDAMRFTNTSCCLQPSAALSPRRRHDYNDEDVTNFDEVVVPMREAAKEALRPRLWWATNASSNARGPVNRGTWSGPGAVIVGGGPAGFSAATMPQVDLEPLVVAALRQLEGARPTTTRASPRALMRWTWCRGSRSRRRASALK